MNQMILKKGHISNVIQKWHYDIIVYKYLFMRRAFW